MTVMEYVKKATILAIPMIILSLMQSSLGLIDQLMIADLGEDAITAVAVSNKYTFLFFFLVVGFSNAIGIFVAQYTKQGRMGEVNKLFNISYFISIVLLAPYFLISLLKPEVLFSLFTDTDVILEYGAQYQRYMTIVIFTTIFTPLYAALFRSSGKTIQPLVAGFVALVLNTVLNYLLISGNLGFEALGIEGAAIATATSKVVELIILILLLFREKYIKYVKLSFEFFSDKELFKKFIIVSVPAIVSGLAWAFSEFLYSVYYAKLGDSALAAFNITSPLISIIWGILGSVAAAFGIIIGNTQGEGDADEAYRLGLLSFPIAWVGGIIFAIVVLLVDSLYLDLYGNISPDTRMLSEGVIKVTILFLFFKIGNMVTSNAVINTGGKTTLSLGYATISIYGVGVPLAIYTTTQTNLDLIWVFAIVNIEEVVRFTLGAFIIKSKRWINTL